MMKALLTGVWASVLAMAIPAVALGQSPVSDVYGGNGGSLQGDVNAGLESTAGGGALPFTGVDLAVMVAAAIMLIVVGLTVRRAARSEA